MSSQKVQNLRVRVNVTYLIVDTRPFVVVAYCRGEVRLPVLHMRSLKAKTDESVVL